MEMCFNLSLLGNQSIILLLNILLLINIVILFVLISDNIKTKSKVLEKNKLNSDFSEDEVEKSLSNLVNDNTILDPFEIKFIKALKEKEKPTGLNVLEMNDLMNLTKCSLENQRQRRHIILKELNRKLFPVSGKRESIIRYPNEQDRREIIYDLDPELKSLEELNELLN